MKTYEKNSTCTQDMLISVPNHVETQKPNLQSLNESLLPSKTNSINERLNKIIFFLLNNI